MDQMEYSDTTIATNTISSSNSPQSRSCSSSPPPATRAGTTPVVMSPCAACKILRRRCADKCVLAPYFPPTEPAKFTIAHRVFGASNIIKFLQDLPESQRADAVSSMVYEASARIRDPVYGCAGAICQLQKQVNELQAQLAKSQAEMVNMQHQQANLVALLCMEITPAPSQSPSPSTSPPPHRDYDHYQQQYSPPAHDASMDNLMMITSAPQFYHTTTNPNCLLDETILGSTWEPLWA